MSQESDASRARSASSPDAQASRSTAVPESAIVRVDLGDLESSASLGPDDAPVTVVAFIDYQCPFCARAHATLQEIASAYGKDVRIVFKQHPLEFHPEAELAAEAALAASVLGEFPRMHALLLENQKELGRENLPDLARAAGLDQTTFERALDSGDFKADVEADLELAKRIGITSTPFFFVNGRPVRGAQPYGVFKALIDQELAGPAAPTRWVEHLEKAPHRASRGGEEREPTDTARSELAGLRPTNATEAALLRHVARLEDELQSLRGEIRELRKSVAVLASATRSRSSDRSARPSEDLVAPIGDVPLGDDPSQGSEDAPIAIVAFADYGCPYSRKFARYVLPSIRERYVDTGRARYIFRDRPLDYHPRSIEAAIAANCAGKQDAYWKMHDALFALDGSLEDADFAAIAGELGLDVSRFEECLDDPAEAREVDDDIADADSAAIGLRVVPSFLIGRVEGGKLVDVKRVGGVQTVRALTRLLDDLVD